MRRFFMALAALPLSGAAFAQPDEAGVESHRPGSRPPPPPPVSPASATSPVERLPPSAYPNVPIRGIEGGSLWLQGSMNGLQWPRYETTGIGVSGYAWIDTGYQKIRRGSESQQDIQYWLQQGRALLRVTPTYTSGRWFVQGQAELVANKDQSLSQPDSPDTDDLWVRFGQWGSWDVQLGRYEGWEVYHFGMGLDLNTLERNGATDQNAGVPAIYGVTYAYYRPAGVGNVAGHIYFTDSLRLELLTQVGNEFGQNALGGRPVLVLDLGWLKVKGGTEYKKARVQQVGGKETRTLRGSGGAVQVVLDPRFEAGVSFGYGLIDHIDVNGAIDAPGSTTTMSYGAFANLRLAGDLLLGAGANYTEMEDIHFDPTVSDVGRFSHLQSFAAVQYVFARQLLVKIVGAYARSELAPTFTMSPRHANDMFSARLRFLYLF